ncbi:MAG: helix-turn-helix transcriptional regulator [Bacteroidetes bacterium]|nr:helix-turn-helix transcriptional regulator [Bacteroidota bacterium]
MSSNTLRLAESKNSKNHIPVDLVALKKSALVLRALNHKLRQQILRLIADNEMMPVTDIYVKLRLEQSVASQHLAILRKAGFVKTKREGKFIYYSPNLSRVRQVNQITQTLAGN